MTIGRKCRVFVETFYVDGNHCCNPFAPVRSTFSKSLPVTFEPVKSQSTITDREKSALLKFAFLKLVPVKSESVKRLPSRFAPSKSFLQHFTPTTFAYGSSTPFKSNPSRFFCDTDACFPCSLLAPRYTPITNPAGPSPIFTVCHFPPPPPPAMNAA